MARTANYGLKALIASCRFCATPDCDCKDNMELVGKRVNLAFGPSHKIEEADLRAICLDLDEHPISGCPDSSGSDDKQRDDGNFDRVVEEAFKVSYRPNNTPSLPYPVCLSLCEVRQSF